MSWVIILFWKSNKRSNTKPLSSEEKIKRYRVALELVTLKMVTLKMFLEVAEWLNMPIKIN